VSGPPLTVAVLGTGVMGGPMARNIARAGLAVRAWNRKKSEVKEKEKTKNKDKERVGK